MEVKWKGVYPAVLTQFNAQDELDQAMFRINIQAQIDAGVHGIIVGGSLGEASTLTQAERMELVDICLELCANKIPVIVNIAERSSRDAISQAKEAEAKGADGIMLLPPMQYKADDREVVHYFRSVAEATSLPIMIYNNPVDYKIFVSVPMFQELVQHDNIQAVKESTRDLTNVTRMRNAFGDRIKIMGGVDTLAVECFAMGADGWVAGLVDAFPRETVVIYELMMQGRLEEARKLFAWFLPLLELDINPKLVQNIKLAGVATGISNEYVRAPRLPLAGEERKQVQKIIDDSLAVRPELPAV